MGSGRPISGAYAGYQDQYFSAQGTPIGPMQGRARAALSALAPSQPPRPPFVTPNEPPRPPTPAGEESVPPLPNPLLPPTPTQSQGGGESKPSGPAPGGQAMRHPYL